MAGRPIFDGKGCPHHFTVVHHAQPRHQFNHPKPLDWHDDLYPGLFDDVQVHDEALSAGQVASLFGNPGSEIPAPSVIFTAGLASLLAVFRRR